MITITSTYLVLDLEQGQEVGIYCNYRGIPDIGLHKLAHLARNLRSADENEP